MLNIGYKKRLGLLDTRSHFSWRGCFINSLSKMKRDTLLLQRLLAFPIVQYFKWEWCYSTSAGGIRGVWTCTQHSRELFSFGHLHCNLINIDCLNFMFNLFTVFKFQENGQNQPTWLLSFFLNSLPWKTLRKHYHSDQTEKWGPPFFKHTNYAYQKWGKQQEVSLLGDALMLHICHTNQLQMHLTW